MGLSDRASTVVQQLLYNQEAQEAIGRAGSAARDAYARARGKSPQAAVSDKKLRRRLQQAAGAAREAWSAIDEPPRRQPGRGLKLVALAVCAGGVFVAANAKARENVLSRLGKNEATTEPMTETSS